jgi:hypothetical protein
MVVQENTQQPNGSLNMTGQGYPHNCEEATSKDKQSETLHQ